MDALRSYETWVHLPVDTASHHRRPESSAASLRERHISVCSLVDDGNVSVCGFVAIFGVEVSRMGYKGWPLL